MISSYNIGEYNKSSIICIQNGLWGGIYKAAIDVIESYSNFFCWYRKNGDYMVLKYVNERWKNWQSVNLPNFQSVPVNNGVQSFYNGVVDLIKRKWATDMMFRISAQSFIIYLGANAGIRIMTRNNQEKRMRLSKLSFGSLLLNFTTLFVNLGREGDRNRALASLLTAGSIATDMYGSRHFATLLKDRLIINRRVQL